MGCVQQRPFKPRPQSQHYKPENPSPKPGQMTKTAPPHQNNKEYNNNRPQTKKEIPSAQASSKASTKTNKEIISKYAIAPRENLYSTPCIHSYNYHCLIEYNPSKISLTKSKKIVKTTSMPLEEDTPESHLNLTVTKH